MPESDAIDKEERAELREESWHDKILGDAIGYTKGLVTVLDSLSEGFRRRGREIEEQRQRLTVLQSERRAILEERARLETQLASLAAEHAALRADLEERDRQIAGFRQELSQGQARLEASTKEIQELQTAVQDSNRQAEELREIVRSLERQLSRVRQSPGRVLHEQTPRALSTTEHACEASAPVGQERVVLRENLDRDSQNAPHQERIDGPEEMTNREKPVQRERQLQEDNDRFSTPINASRREPESKGEGRRPLAPGAPRVRPDEAASGQGLQQSGLQDTLTAMKGTLPAPGEHSSSQRVAGYRSPFVGTTVECRLEGLGEMTARTLHGRISRISPMGLLGVFEEQLPEGRQVIVRFAREAQEFSCAGLVVRVVQSTAASGRPVVFNCLIRFDSPMTGLPQSVMDSPT